METTEQAGLFHKSKVKQVARGDRPYAHLVVESSHNLVKDVHALPDTPIIDVQHLCKYYQTHQKEPGLIGSLRSFISRKYEDVKAVDDLSFRIEAGEVVGFLGPNGAGKTTTLKVLSGLLYPTRGTVSVLGYTPYDRKPAYLRQFTLVMGQKQQLLWDLPAIETFLVNQAIYEIPDAQFKAMLGELTALLDLEPLLKKQVRKLSLGERMKCELAAALLHRPRVLFLDEPTIGLDVTMQTNIRQFVAQYNQRWNATVILTSHYMADVTALCKRVIVINEGKLIYDGGLRALAEKIAPYKLVRVDFAELPAGHDLSAYGEVRRQEGLNAELLVPREQTSIITARMLAELPIADLTIEEPAIEEVIGRVFAGEGQADAA
ncbi:MAG: ATP-binding cassette domain-containing protein [Chloroflexi bacterium]|nr:ATP-binding cassette domain-containing protein [Chloroflexota bacterium]